MLLVIDVGNTNIVYGVYVGEELVFDWRTSSDKNKTSDEYGLLFKDFFDFATLDIEQLKDIIISSVVPNLMHTISVACSKYLGKEPIIVSNDIDLGIKNLYKNPNEVGTDRLVTAVGAYEKYGGPSIIVDIGTAITLDYINKNGEYIGGIIAPGIEISADALFNKTAKLPKIDIDIPKRVIGKSTRESMQSGLVFGFIGLIDSLIERILESENLTKDDVRIIGTGGFAALISHNSKYIELVDKMLTMEGLKLIYERNQKSPY
ncbi:MAG: type III pantothenate kinase [Miniphocaeibacter sp.]|uniref:type III pantothenate kinase n=1 Tax=Miniphocaeibacter sp. TaxID=3100973 RepID=UPI0017E2EAC9|nr:type III pantothenate kinase [Gallicola sp.]